LLLIRELLRCPVKGYSESATVAVPTW
jgi:hypothetical protein